MISFDIFRIWGWEKKFTISFQYFFDAKKQTKKQLFIISANLSAATFLTLLLIVTVFFSYQHVGHSRIQVQLPKNSSVDSNFNIKVTIVVPVIAIDQVASIIATVFWYKNISELASQNPWILILF